MWWLLACEVEIKLQKSIIADNLIILCFQRAIYAHNDAILAFTDVLRTKISSAIEFPIPPPPTLYVHISWGFVPAKQKSTNTISLFPFVCITKRDGKMPRHILNPCYAGSGLVVMETCWVSPRRDSSSCMTGLQVSLGSTKMCLGHHQIDTSWRSKTTIWVQKEVAELLYCLQ
jgi:hypothetical protein